MQSALKCPICRTAVSASNPESPFCSERCRTLDLGAWASGGYRISSPILDPDLLEEVEHQQQQANPFASGATKEWKH